MACPVPTPKTSSRPDPHDATAGPNRCGMMTSCRVDVGLSDTVAPPAAASKSGGTVGRTEAGRVLDDAADASVVVKSWSPSARAPGFHISGFFETPELRWTAHIRPSAIVFAGLLRASVLALERERGHGLLGKHQPSPGG